jgi:hypothetical protein
MAEMPSSAAMKRSAWEWEVMDVCSGYRQEQTPAGKDDAATLTLHFCDEDFASVVRKNYHDGA